MSLARVDEQTSLKRRWLFVHNILMVGPPGAGKTLLARAVPGIMPRMTVDESLDVTRIYSVADQLPADVPMVRSRPFSTLRRTIDLL